MYVAAKGGLAAIEASWRLLAEERRGDPALPEVSIGQLQQQMRLAVDRVMSEGSLYDPELAALALKQAQGDVIEAVFLLRAYRTTLPRLASSVPLDTADIELTRRISAVFKDLPGGQLLGPTYDYTQRLLDFSLLADPSPDAQADCRPLATGSAATVTAMASQDAEAAAGLHARGAPQRVPRVHDLLHQEGLIEGQRQTPRSAAAEPSDITREPLLFPADRATRLQVLARADEGWLLALGYSTQRGYANGHPFAGEIRRGYVAVEVVADELGFALDIGDIELTECQMINQFTGSLDEPPTFTVGYGLAFGGAERKAMAMALVDRALRARELGEEVTAPAQDEEFVLLHGDSVESSGFVQHLKLPHHVDFQSELELVRRLRAEHRQGGTR